MNVAQYTELQTLVVAEIKRLNPNVAVFTLRRRDGGPLAPMRAGQYLSLGLQIGESFAARPYSICSSPKDAREGLYRIALEQYPGGFFPNAAQAALAVGDEVEVRGPVGTFCYDPAQDAPHAIFLSGGTAVTPFLSMLRAIDEGDEDFSATLLLGSRTRADILFREELDRLAQNPKIEVVHVLSDEIAAGYAHGLLDPACIARYAPADGQYSLFFCGPGGMYQFLDGELPKLGIPAARLHHEMYAVPRALAARADYPGDPAAVYTLTVEDAGRRCADDGADRVLTLPMRADETVLCALERGGVRAKQLCHSGECGFCEATLLSGEVYLPQFGFSDKGEPRLRGKLHPCCSFPLGNLHIRL